MLKSVLRTVTFQQSQITIASTMINGILGALFYIFMARFLGPADFGLLSVSIITLTLVSDIADLGTNTGLVRFVSSNLNSNRDRILKFLKFSLEVKFFIWLSILLLGFSLSSFIANSIFGKPELNIPLKLVTIGVGGAFFFSFAMSALQSFQKFLLWGAINIASNLLRLILIFLLFSSSQLNLFSSLTSYIAISFFGFSLALFFLPTKEIITVTSETVIKKDFFNFNKWVALFTFIAAISSRLDTFLNARLLSSSDIGIYSAANQLTQVVPQIIGALGVVAAPKFATFHNLDQMLTYFKKFQLMVIGLSLLVILAIPASFYFIPLLYGQQYQGSIPPFIILLLAMVIFLISVPLHNSIIYYFGKPQVFVWVAVGHLLIVAILGYFLISSYGVVGAATTVAIGMIFNFFAPLLWFFQRIRKQ